jgi:hypothetical protein
MIGTRFFRLSSASALKLRIVTTFSDPDLISNGS